MEKNEQREELPVFELKSIQPFGSATIKLDCSRAIKTGESEFGTWNLWVGYVTNQKVVAGKGKNKKDVASYSGKVLFFPTKNVDEKLEQLAEGNVDVEVKITKVLSENEKGQPMKKYEVEKLSNGRPFKSSYSQGELKLIDDIKTLTSKHYKVTETDVLNFSKDSKYGGNIKEEIAKQIFKEFIK